MDQLPSKPADDGTQAKPDKAKAKPRPTGDAQPVSDTQPVVRFG